MNPSPIRAAIVIIVNRVEAIVWIRVVAITAAKPHGDGRNQSREKDPRLPPGNQNRGHTSIIDLKPAYAQMSQNGTSMQNGVTSVAATRVNIKVSSPVTPCRAMMGIPRPPKATGAVLPATIVPRILPV